jgi:hypothetical protein
MVKAKTIPDKIDRLNQGIFDLQGTTGIPGNFSRNLKALGTQQGDIFGQFEFGNIPGNT